MSYQYEAGTQRPMRPATALVVKNAGTAKTLIRDTGAVDWTVATTKLPLDAIESQFCNEDGYVGLDAANDEIDLRAGIYHVRARFDVTNTDAVNNENLLLAITNAGGTVVHKATSALICPAGDTRQVEVECLIHLATDQAIVVRAVQNTDTGGADDFAITNKVVTVLVAKFGNKNETGL